MKTKDLGVVDYHTHPYAHGEKNIGVSEMQSFIEQAQKKGLKELGFSDHDMFLEQINWEQLKFVRDNSSFPLRLGLEIGYRSGKQDYFRRLLDRLPLDYIIGSVHFIGDWNFDHPDYCEQFEKKNIDQIYSEYYQLVTRAVETELFDIVGHLDLIKIFNFFPDRISLYDLVAPVLEIIKEKNLVVEINTNGLNKPVGEIYPSRKIIKWMKEENIPVTLGSDAHEPMRVGENFQQVISLLKEIGYRKITKFKNRQKEFIKI